MRRRPNAALLCIAIAIAIAFALQHGTVTPRSFDEEYLVDANIARLISVLRIDEDPQFTARYPLEYNCRLQVRTRDGQRFDAVTTHPRGHPRNPLTDTQVESKFHALAQEVLAPDKCAAALRLLWSLESAPDLGALLDQLIIEPLQ